jgi:large subunit ribosomal protein L25
MADITLHADIRTAHGSRPAGRLRAAGKLPAVLYGKGIDPVSLELDHHAVSKALQDATTRGEELNLVVGATTHRVKLHAIQRDPVRRTAAHLDFLAI